MRTACAAVLLCFNLTIILVGDLWRNEGSAADTIVIIIILTVVVSILDLQNVRHEALSLMYSKVFL